MSSVSTLQYERIEPDKQYTWVDHVENDWDGCLEIVSNEAKNTRSKFRAEAIFKSFSLGLEPKTREWLHDASSENLVLKANHFVTEFNSAVSKMDFPNDRIKWHRELLKKANARTKVGFDEQKIIQMDFRPFKRFHFYNEPKFISMNFRQQNYFPVGQSNFGFIFTGVGATKPFSHFGIKLIPEHDFIEKSQVVPRNHLSKDGKWG